MSNKCSAYNIPQFVSPVSTGMVISSQTQGNSIIDTLSVGGCFAGLANPGQKLIGANNVSQKTALLWVVHFQPLLNTTQPAEQSKTGVQLRIMPIREVLK